ncbi:MAG: ATP-binding protein, partial [Thermoanaerobaculia bacterium]
MTHSTTTSASDPLEPNRLEALCATLRALRLPAMALALPGLLDEAEREGWGKLELLAELFEREALEKGTRRYERRLKASGLSEAYALACFDFELAHRHGVEPSVVRDLAQSNYIRARRNIILAGGVGTGKSHLARTLGIEALKRGFKVLAFNTAELVEWLYSKRSSFQFGKVYGAVRDTDLLILDDLAYMPYAPERVEFLFSLIVDRHELAIGSTIVTSNTDVTEWWQYFPSKAMGMAFSDRLLEGA